MKKFLVLHKEGGFVQKSWITGDNKKNVSALYSNVIGVFVEKDIVNIKANKNHKHHDIIKKHL